MKSAINGQAKPGTKSKLPGKGADKPWDNELDYTVIGKESAPEQAPAFRAGPEAVPGRQERIAIIAYYKAQHRGFANSGALDDWLEAEREVDRLEKT